MPKIIILLVGLIIRFYFSNIIFMDKITDNIYHRILVFYIRLSNYPVVLERES